jgi:hypothetical protein
MTESKVLAFGNTQHPMHPLLALAVGDSPLPLLILCCGIPIVAAVWALLAPSVVVSREMTWDLLFNLAGAWHVFNGQVPHVDFHDPGGALPFYLTAIGFHVVGPRPIALLVGSVAIATIISVIALLVAWRRLSLAAAVLFVLFTSYQVLMPANLGDQPNAYSFAMSYNRYCWAAIGVLALLLFVSPRPGRHSDLSELVLAAILLMLMLETKITYFAAGMAMIAGAVPLVARLRALWHRWALMFFVVALYAVSPANHAYMRDILAAASSGAMRTNLVVQLNFFLDHAGEYAWSVLFCLASFLLWRRGGVPVAVPAGIAMMFGLGLLLLSQNSQSHAMPLAVVACFVMHDALRHSPLLAGGRVALPLLTLTFPALALAVEASGIAAYARAADGQRLEIVERTNLKGLAVPVADTGLLTAFGGDGSPVWELLNRSRESRARHELLPAEYVSTLLEASDLVAARNAPGSILVLDQVNPLPFMLGVGPPKGVWVWFDAPESGLSDVPGLTLADIVLVPKFATWGAGSRAAFAAARGVLANEFVADGESRSWFVYVRAHSRISPAEGRPHLTGAGFTPP